MMTSICNAFRTWGFAWAVRISRRLHIVLASVSLLGCSLQLLHDVMAAFAVLITWKLAPHHACFVGASSFIKGKCLMSPTLLLLLLQNIVTKLDITVFAYSNTLLPKMILIHICAVRQKNYVLMGYIQQ